MSSLQQLYLQNYIDDGMRTWRLPRASIDSDCSGSAYFLIENAIAVGDCSTVINGELIRIGVHLSDYAITRSESAFGNDMFLGERTPEGADDRVRGKDIYSRMRHSPEWVAEWIKLSAI